MPLLDWSRVRAVLFDVDGTLLDSNAAHARAWADALHEHGIEVAEVRVRGLIGKGGDKLLPEVAGISEHSPRGERIAARKGELFAARLPTLSATPGARALLEFLTSRGVSLGVATSAGDTEVEALLRQAGVADLIRVRASKDDAGSSKPDPDIVQASLDKVGAAAPEAVLVGDTPYDIAAAAAAGVPAIALRCGGFWADVALRDARAIFDNPAALLAALKGGDDNAARDSRQHHSG